MIDYGKNLFLNFLLVIIRRNIVSYKIYRIKNYDLKLEKYIFFFFEKDNKLFIVFYLKEIVIKWIIFLMLFLKNIDIYVYV